MDTASIAAAMAAGSAGQTQAALSAKMVRMNADMAAGLAAMVAENAERAAALVADGVGGNVDVSA